VIRIEVGQLENARTEGILRPVDSSLEALNQASRQLESSAGEEVVARLRQMGEIPVGGAVVTPAGQLSSTLLIHVVIESPEEPASAMSIRRALTNGLRQATEWSLESLSLPPLGIGAGRYDAEWAARIMLPLVRDHQEQTGHPETVVIVVANDYEEDAFARELERSVSRSPGGDA
jgi:O-acetyl-ADP-ribose deacetylase (regulator of RNase III)